MKHLHIATRRLQALRVAAITIALLHAGLPGVGISRAAEPPAAKTVVRDERGRITRIEGPGYSLSRAPALAPEAGTPPAATGPQRSRLEAPVVCSRGVTLELRDVELVTEGAGVIARDGCELRLSAVEIRAGGWALIAEAGARVRVDASVLEGRTGSVDAAPGAALSAWSTVFRGPPGRPLRAPEFIDRGGNAWD